MPALDEKQLRWLRNQFEQCPMCIGWILRNYCRECDVFFWYGHWEGCPEWKPNEHKDHRTY